MCCRALSRTSSMASIGTQYTTLCDQLAETLVSKQVQFCKKHPAFMLSVQSGASRAIDECKFQFRTRRWNCSTLDEGRHLPTIVPLPPPQSFTSKRKPKGKIRLARPQRAPVKPGTQHKTKRNQKKTEQKTKNQKTKRGTTAFISLTQRPTVMNGGLH